MSKKSSNTSSRGVVHPCVVNVWDGSPGGAEYATYADLGAGQLPHLVTAQGSTLTIYSIDPDTSKLIVRHKFTDLAGSICYLATLKSQNEDPDALLMGFAGYPRLSIVTVTPDLLQATSLIDLTSLLQEASIGATSTLEQDLQASLNQTSPGRATVSVILGGGVSVACLDLAQHAAPAGWSASQPYVLPLKTLGSAAEEVAAVADTAPNTASISTGFGDILATSFLKGYSEPTMVLLHSHAHSGGQTWSGRLGREHGGTRHGLVVTAVTVTVAHERSAVLWSTEVPADSLQVYCATNHGCLVRCVNSIVAISNTGQVNQVLAMNGWVRTGLPLSLQSLVKPNPWPFPALAVALDGAEISFVNETTALIILRTGPVYLLQYQANLWSVLPLYTTIGGLGQVSTVISHPLDFDMTSIWTKEDPLKPTNNERTENSLFFVASRLGDSSLLGLALAESSIEDALRKEPALKEGTAKQEPIYQPGDEEYERILQLEEEALYAQDTDGNNPDVVPPSDDDEDGVTGTTNPKRKRAKLTSLTVVQSMTVLDSITALGPLGPACTGPLTQGRSEILETTGKAPPALGATGYVYPCGYGSSGGVALLTVPGRDDRTILAEEDCINTKALFSLPSRGLVLLSMRDQTRFLKIEQGSMGQAMVEVDMTNWMSHKLQTLLQVCELLAACERDSNTFCLLVAMSTDQDISYSLLVINDQAGNLELETNIPLPVPKGEAIRSVAPLAQQVEDGEIVLGYTLSTGQAKIVRLDASGGVHGFSFESYSPMDMDDAGISAEEKFYKWGTIGAMDIFKAPKALFPGLTLAKGDTVIPKTDVATEPSSNVKQEISSSDYSLEEEDRALYGEATKAPAATEIGESMNSTKEQVDLTEERWFVAIARQSGSLEIFALDTLSQGTDSEPLWKTSGCGHGVSVLSPDQTVDNFRFPVRHQVQASEIRFFLCGPSKPKAAPSPLGPTTFCLSMETSDGDLMLYKAELCHSDMSTSCFRRVPLKDPARPSKEQGKHYMKLRRKGIAKKDLNNVTASFRHNDLFRFKNLSRQDGLFAATSRPVWFVAERGYPTVLSHRCRHVAPAGAKAKPIAGFCTGVLVSTLKM